MIRSALRLALFATLIAATCANVVAGPIVDGATRTSLAGPVAFAQDGAKPDDKVRADDDAAKKDPRSPFHKALAAYLVALDRAFVAHATHGRLGVSVHIYPDAWEYEVLSFTAERLERGDAPATIQAKLRRDEEKLKPLRGQLGLRIELTHPHLEDDAKGVAEDDVHFFPADLRSAFDVRFRNRPFRWSKWKDPTHLESARVQIARHWKSENRRLVPVMSELKPKGPRAVFRGKSATIWGVFPAKGEPTDLSFHIEYEEFQGLYDDRHVIDLNEEKNHFRQELEISGNRPGRWVIPSRPADVEGYLETVRSPSESD